VLFCGFRIPFLLLSPRQNVFGKAGVWMSNPAKEKL
jgi:hypothetical protein